VHRSHISPEAGTIGQLVADVPSGLSLTPPKESKKGNPTVRVGAALTDTEFYSEGARLKSLLGHRQS
jgi:hypothetical protein